MNKLLFDLYFSTIAVHKEKKENRIPNHFHGEKWMQCDYQK